jgi:hypothetical protein
MQSVLKGLPLGSLLAVGILGLAALGQLAAIVVGTMPGRIGFAFAGFAFSGAFGVLAAHRNPSRSRRMRIAECIVGSIAGAAFLSVAIYSLFEKL